jgi:RNA polymerase sigma-70 factor (ECF subfamily)
VDERGFLETRFEEQRPHLRSVAYRMLGSLAEADDAVQEAWVRVQRAGADDVENLGGWFTTITARVCLNQMRSRTRRREDSLEVFVSDPIVSPIDAPSADPEQEALLADSVGLALLVVLELLTPAERMAFVLHDLFAVPFDEIAGILDRTPEATRQLASRARRRVQGTPTVPDADLVRQREVVAAFFAAAREGDFDALVSILDPDVVLRGDGGKRVVAGGVYVGADAVAGRALHFRQGAQWVHPAIVNGVAGVVVAPHGRVVSIMAFTVRDGRIVAIDSLADPERLKGIDVSEVVAGGDPRRN